MNEVEKFYDGETQDEWERLERHKTEYALTMRAFAQFLPPPPMMVLDIGGGPGRYAIELARQGYEVTLADLSSGNLALARQKAEAAGVVLRDYLHLNALDLSSLVGNGFDFVLLMGPLYHLTALVERKQALQQALSVLKPGGWFCASFITRYAPFRDGAASAATFVEADPAYSRQMLATGIHDSGDGFTRAYFALPGEIEPLMVETGLQTRLVLGVEGMVAGHEDHINTLTGEAWELWLELNYIAGQDAYNWGAADHLLYIGTKPQ